jgi:adenylate cyclase
LICYNCGNLFLSEMDKNCPLCGMNFPVKCENCNEFNPLYSKYCCNCGVKLINNSYGSLTKNSVVLNETRKNVAVIFADVSGFTALSEKMDPEEIREIINGCFEYITKPVYELEGTIDKFIGDCVMILFGAKYSHPDDAKRAVKCALEMRDLIKEYSKERLFGKGIRLELSIGINYGLVVTGKVGNQYDKDYTVMGDTVNTAQRLQSAAGKGNILVSEQCAAQSSDLIRYSEQKEIQVKNKEKPVKCFNALEILKDQDVDSNILFERENELELINKIYNDSHNKRFVNVVGESGIGKSSLIRKFCSESHVSDARQIWINCSSLNRNKGYYVLNSLLLSITGIISEDEMDVKKNKLRSYINFILKDFEDEKIEKNYDFLTLIMGLEKSEDFNKILKSMEYKDLVREINLQLELFFENLYRLQNYIFIIDDIQWADEVSIEILKKLIERMNSARSFYIFSSHHVIDELNDESNQILLNKISEAGLKDMVRSEFKCIEINVTLLNRLFDLSNGNPLYAKEYISAIKRSRQYFIENDMLCINENYINQIPDSIENIILSNLSGLDDTTITFLQVASCIGKEFNINWIWKIMRRNLEDEGVTYELRRLNIISLKSIYTSEGILNKVYIFNQDTVRNVIYKSILNKNKKEFNRSIGELIEREYGYDIEGYYAELYNYFLAAENLTKARDYANKAAKKYKEEFNFKNALDFYDVFIDLMNSYKENETDQRLSHVYKDMGYIKNTLGESDKAIEVLNKALILTTYAEEAYSIKLMIAEIYKDRAQYDNAFKIIEDIEHMIRENSNIYGKMLLLKCNIYFFKRAKNTLTVAVDSEKILLKNRDYDNLSQTQNLIGLYYFSKGDTSNALHYFNSAYEHSEKVGNIKFINKISGNLGLIYHILGRVSKSLEYFNKNLQTSKIISDTKSFITSNINLGILYMGKGSFNKAEDLLNKALEISDQVSLIYQQCTALINMGDLIYERGMLEEALSYFNEALAISIKHEMKAEEGISYINIAKVKIKQGAFDEVDKLLDRSYTILEEINEISGLIDFYMYKCKKEMINKNFETAQEYCDKSIHFAEESEDDFKKIIALRLKGNICVERGMYEDALELYNASIKLSEQLESEYQCAKGYYSRAKLNKLLNMETEWDQDLHLVEEYISKVDQCEWKAALERKKYR